MTEFSKTWRRWCGPRAELVRAVEYAEAEVRDWTGVPPTVRVRVAYKTGLTDPGLGTEAIDAILSAELGQVESLAIDIAPDLSEFVDARIAAQAKGEAEPERAEVAIRISSYSTTLTVDGVGRARVEGVSQRLVQMLKRGATNTPGFDRAFIFVVGLPLGLSIGALLGMWVSRWLGLAEMDQEWNPAEIVGATIGALVALASVLGAWWLFPPVELFDEGGAGRFRRFRAWVFAGAGALVIGVAGSFVYDQVG